MSNPSATAPAQGPTKGILWRNWDAETFRSASREKRLIMVNVATAWCHWCHVMDEETFGDPIVARLLEKHFTCVRVDADARPDLGERYAEWGWPATAFLTPEATALTELRGYQDPAKFADILRELVDGHTTGELQGRIPRPAARPFAGDLESLRDRVQMRLDSFFDERIGGWGRTQKYPFPGPVEDALLRSPRDPAWLDRAILTLDGTMNLLDPVWGGLFQYSVQGRWDEPHFEKIAVIQAGGLDNFGHAFQMTRKRRFLGAARAIESYLNRFLRDPSGAFWTSQDADVAESRMTGDQFYRLAARDRLRVGMPGTDKAIYADWNGLLILALVRLYRATLDAGTLASALGAADALLATHQTEGGSFTHAAGAGDVLHLRDNAAMGRALLALHEATDHERFLLAATKVGEFLLGPLQAPEGGFRMHTEDRAATGVFAQRRRPLEENGMATRFLIELAWRIGDGESAARFRMAAERAMRTLGDARLVEGEGRVIGQFLLGLEWLVAEPTKIIIQGEPNNHAAIGLHLAALQALTGPGLVRWAMPGEYPDRGQPAAYVCSGRRCSRPVFHPQLLKPALRELLGA